MPTSACSPGQLEQPHAPVCEATSQGTLCLHINFAPAPWMSPALFQGCETQGYKMRTLRQTPLTAKPGAHITFFIARSLTFEGWSFWVPLGLPSAGG